MICFLYYTPQRRSILTPPKDHAPVDSCPSSKPCCLSFVVFDKLRRSNVDLSQFQDTNSWFGKLKEKYSAQIDEFIAKNSGELVDLKKDNKKKEKNPKQAEPKKVAPAAPKKEHVAKKKEEISEDYRNLVKSLRLKRVKVTNEILPVADKKNVLIMQYPKK